MNIRTQTYEQKSEIDILSKILPNAFEEKYWYFESGNSPVLHELSELKLDFKFKSLV